MYSRSKTRTEYAAAKRKGIGSAELTLDTHSFEPFQLQMTLSQQISNAFDNDENYVLIEPPIGRVLITRRQYKSVMGTLETTYKAELLEKGTQMFCTASNPFAALISLSGHVNVKEAA